MRPTLSPKWPKIAAPTGRARKAMAKVASELSSAEFSSVDGKKRCGKTITAAVA
ncbi:hypothetical protein D3C86_2183980 [compost metagenome]